MKQLAYEIMVVGVEKGSHKLIFVLEATTDAWFFFFIHEILFNLQIRFGKEGRSIEKHTVPVK